MAGLYFYAECSEAVEINQSRLLLCFQRITKLLRPFQKCSANMVPNTIGSGPLNSPNVTSEVHLDQEATGPNAAK